MFTAGEPAAPTDGSSAEPARLAPAASLATVSAAGEPPEACTERTVKAMAPAIPAGSLSDSVTVVDEHPKNIKTTSTTQ
jgi:hypothetical protein